MSNILVIASDIAKARELVKSTTGSSLENDSWRIDNKYYTAVVQFIFRSVEQLPPDMDELDAPGVIYVYEGATESFNKVASVLKEGEHEVMLAISASPQSQERADELEEFFSEHGFEYLTTDTEGSCPRLVDALSTIMWPNMVRKSTTSKSQTRTQAQEMDDEMIAMLSRSLLAEGSGSAASAYDAELEALERWLDDEEDEDEEPHVGSAWPTVSKTAVASSESGPLAFEDDFAPFVSAPSRLPPSTPSTPLEVSTAQYEQMEDTGHDHDHDDDLPSASEILQTSRQLSQDSDLSSILSSLQGMKEQIATIQDEDERRKAAARVALGFMWSMNTDSGVDEHEGQG